MKKYSSNDSELEKAFSAFLVPSGVNGSSRASFIFL
jgi:hypothetical protein